jgi:hypothetical protein
VLDRWSTGLRLAITGGGTVTVADPTIFLESISAAVSSFHQNTSVKAGSNVYLDKLEAVVLGTDGKYWGSTAVATVRDYAPPVAGNATGVLPWNSALVISQRTDFKRGYASNGRMYWPAVAQVLDNGTGRLSTGAIGPYLAAAKTMYDTINTQANAFQAGLAIHVMSAVAPGYNAPVRSLRMDTRVDSIERRENQQPAAYTSVNLA